MMYGASCRHGRSPRIAKTRLTTGLKCAPEIGGEDRDDDHQHGRGRNRVSEQRQTLVPPGQAGRHDAGTDDDRYQQPRSEGFRA